MKNYSKGYFKSHKHHLHDPAVQALGPMFYSLLVLTVFGFGMNRAIFWAVFRNQHRTEQIWTALQLGTNPSAKVRYLVRSSYNLGHSPVCFASVPRRKKGRKNDVRSTELLRPILYSVSQSTPLFSNNKAGLAWFPCHLFFYCSLCSHKNIFQKCHNICDGSAKAESAQ